MKKHLKESILLICITIPTVIALAYGFSVIPSPTSQRDSKFDAIRAYNIESLYNGITSYYTSHGKYPHSLAELVATNLYVYPEFGNSNSNITLDPETKKAYEYTFTNEGSPLLCTNFSTDTSKDALHENQYATDNKYSSSQYSVHEKGRKCFNFVQYQCLGSDCAQDYSSDTLIESPIISPTPKILR